MTTFKVAIPLELTGTCVASTLQSIAEYQDMRAIRGSAKPKHGAFRASRVDAMLDLVRRRGSTAIVTVKAQTGREQREFSFEYRHTETAKPASNACFVVFPSRQETDPSFMEKVSLDVSRDMISRGYYRHDGTLRATILVVCSSGWSSSLQISGDATAVKMEELTTIDHEVEQ